MKVLILLEILCLTPIPLLFFLGWGEGGASHTSDVLLIYGYARKRNKAYDCEGSKAIIENFLKKTPQNRIRKCTPRFEQNLLSPEQCLQLRLRDKI